ncbi:MAG: insulinase family protein [Acidobacteria bacterium]|nr:insulinase family protein [Acidobacteriota bacterium]
MKSFRPVLLVATLLALVPVFLPASDLHAVAQQAPDRSAPPKSGRPPALKPPVIEKRTLSNGLPVWVVELHKVPVVHVSLVVKAGSGIDPKGKYGIASLTADMLDEGAGSRDALQIADAIDYLGASLATDSTSDATSIELHVPVARLGDALPIMADVALRPTFPEDELKRVREDLLTSLIEAQDDPESLIQFAFPRLVFGAEHRYGTLSMGTAATVKALSAADLRQFHAQHYAPLDSLLIVTGDVTAADAAARLERAFGTWKAAAAPAPTVPAPTQLTSRQIYLIDKPGAAQSQIRIGWVGVPRSTPDFFALRVLNTILGGSFTSRLNQNLREEHGYAYGAGSTFDMRAAAGPFYASAGVQTDKTAEALTEFFKELEAIRKPIAPEEIEKAKNFVALLLPRNFETTERVAGSLAQMFIYNLPADYFATYTQRVRAVTPADVQRVAERYIQPDKFAVVIVGDRTTVEPGIKALNLGPLKIVETAEVMK